MIDQSVATVAVLLECLVEDQPVSIAHADTFCDGSLGGVKGRCKVLLANSYGSLVGSIAWKVTELRIDTFTEEELGRRIQCQPIEKGKHIANVRPTVFANGHDPQEVLHMLFFQFQIADLVARELRSQKSARTLPLFAVRGKLSGLALINFQVV